ncbi:MAG TPA: glycosyltransferase [Gammaproteobacteria bacterium]|nr:glycosyltransferase [Gammaproteobacteria bacterium]
MKIIHAIDSLDPALGGPPMCVAGLAAAQAGLGHEVLIYCHDALIRRDEVRAAMSRIPGIERVSIVYCPVGGTFNKLTGMLDARYFEKILGGTDVIHIHGIWRPILKAVCKRSMYAGVGYVVTLHGMLHPWALQQKKWRKKFAMWAGWKKALEGAAFLHVLNKDEASYIQCIGLDTHIEVIPNGVFLTQFENLPAKDEFGNSYPELKYRSYILFIGRLHYVKGLDVLVEAFRLFIESNMGVNLVVVGPDGGERGSLEQLLKALGLADRVHLIGPLYGRDKFAALAGASCYCQPSRQEGFSIAITEAMACGLPVVITKNCNFPEVEQADAGEVVDLDAKKIGKALQRIFEDAQRRKIIGNNAKNLVISRFTWPCIAGQMIEAYRYAPKHV